MEPVTKTIWNGSRTIQRTDIESLHPYIKLIPTELSHKEHKEYSDGA